jgi:excisionase family DNA binding protein
MMLTVNQAAARLGVTPERVRAMIHSGTLEAERFGRVWTLPEAAVVERMLKSPRAGRPKKSGDAASSGHGVLGADKDIGQARELYRQCKAQLAGCYGAGFLLQAQTEEEQGFYLAVADFFLQQRQREVVDAGIY